MGKKCDWCGKCLDNTDSNPLPDRVITHSICGGCRKKVLGELSIPMEEFLEGFDQPVLLVAPEPRVLTANTAARNLLGKDLSHIEGYKGGQIIDCAYARTPEGCGNTIHCESCTIRNSVLQTFETGKPVVEMPAYPDIQHLDETKTYCIRISTEKLGELVLLRIDNMQEQEALQPAEV